MAMWEAIVNAGTPFGLMPYGTEAMSTLRIEKGHIVVGPRRTDAPPPTTLAYASS
jgi:glycine cleavage system aminomethyltransferase T